MKATLSCELKVRSYEMDAYGHANHAVFLDYYEQARVEYLEQKGLSFGSLWREGYLFVIVRAEIDYVKPLTVWDRIQILGQIKGVGHSSVTLQQEIRRLPKREIISRANFVAVFLDKNTGQPVPPPESFQKAFL